MAREIKTFGNIANGKLHIIERGQFLDALAAFPDCDIELTVKRLGKQRSNPQSRYYFGIVVPLIRDAINETQGEKFDKDEVHEWLKQKFNWKEVETENGHVLRIPVSTKKLDTAEFTDYIERCRSWAAQMLDINIPDPVKLTTNEFNV